MEHLLELGQQVRLQDEVNKSLSGVYVDNFKHYQRNIQLTNVLFLFTIKGWYLPGPTL